jgi:YHS domain-containing protein
MPVTYTNRKGHTYYLCQGMTKTGKVRYYFARELKEGSPDQIPEGYQDQRECQRDRITG